MVLAPAKTPADIVQHLSDEIGKVLTDPEVQKTATTLGFEVDPNGPVAPGGRRGVPEEGARELGHIIRELGIEPQ